MKNKNMIAVIFVSLLASFPTAVMADNFPYIANLQNFLSSAISTAQNVFGSIYSKVPFSIFSPVRGYLNGQTYEIPYTCPVQAVNPSTNGIGNVAYCYISGFGGDWRLLSGGSICTASQIGANQSFDCTWQCSAGYYSTAGGTYPDLGTCQNTKPNGICYSNECSSTGYVVQSFTGTCSGAYCQTCNPTIYNCTTGQLLPAPPAPTTCPNNQVSLNGICQNNLFTAPPINCPTGTLSQSVGSGQYSCVQPINASTPIPTQTTAQAVSPIPTPMPTIPQQPQKSFIDLIIQFFSNFFKSLIS